MIARSDAVSTVIGVFLETLEQLAGSEEKNKDRTGSPGAWSTSRPWSPRCAIRSRCSRPGARPGRGRCHADAHLGRERRRHGVFFGEFLEHARIAPSLRPRCVGAAGRSTSANGCRPWPIGCSGDSRCDASGATTLARSGPCKWRTTYTWTLVWTRTRVRNHCMTYERLADRTHDLDVHQKSIDDVRCCRACMRTTDRSGRRGASAALAVGDPPRNYSEGRGRCRHGDRCELGRTAVADQTAVGGVSQLRAPDQRALPAARAPGPVQLFAPGVDGADQLGWAGEGAPKPISKGALTTVTLAIAKAVDIIVLTDELMRLAVPASEVALRD